jgi:hypothetical protein
MPMGNRPEHVATTPITQATKSLDPVETGALARERDRQAQPPFAGMGPTASASTPRRPGPALITAVPSNSSGDRGALAGDPVADQSKPFGARRHDACAPAW